ncbi:MAG: sensor histidine kinase KdpD [Polyangiaceae bacterium]
MNRPDPDALLARVREDERKSKRGKVTIFFGAAPGVGKTFAMLEGARAEIEQGRVVVAGVVETHGRYETGALLIGIDMLAQREVEHRGVPLHEFDLEAAIARKPDLILIDELAHTNAPGSLHAKRWQDVADLADAGIDVFTTLNVQHLESINDVVAQITGVSVKETVPDSVFDEADEVKLVDLPTEDLLERLQSGKIYLLPQAERARENFFKEGNLIALRELALRRTAERVDAQMRGYKLAHGIEPTWHATDRVLVCVSASPHSARLVRAARRMAASLHCELVGLYIETPSAIRMTNADRERLAQNMRLVEQLGGEAVTLRGDDAATETVQYARKRNVTKVVLGKPTHSRWRDVLRSSFLDDVVRLSAEIDVYVISGLPADASTPRVGEKDHARRNERALVGYAASTAAVLTSALLGWLVFPRGELADVIMMFLLGVILVASRFDYGPSLYAAVLSVFAFDFFFVPPYYSFAVSDLRHIVTFGVMFLVATMISGLTKRIREQADAARLRELRTASLYAISRELGMASTRDALLGSAAARVREVFSAKVAVLMPDANGALEVVVADAGTISAADRKDISVADWVWNHGKPAGATTDTLPSSRALFVPLLGARGKVGVLALFPDDPAPLRDPDERHLLETFTGIIGSAIERTVLADEARRAHFRVETEQLRNALLSSVSHDLRTPLAVVTGAASALLDPKGPSDESSRRELLSTIHGEAERLNRLVRNLLDMTRLDAGALKMSKEMQPIEEVVGAALNRVEDRLVGRELTTNLPDDLPLVPLDSILIEQVLINLLENATKYTPRASSISVSATAHDDVVELVVADHGPGVPSEDAERVFDKFYRRRESEGGGVGLGLTICRGIVTAHGGKIWVTASDDGHGAAFHFTLPLDSSAPKVVPLDEHAP